MPASRYVRRPPLRERLYLTVRDIDIFRRLHKHRFMQADHLHALCFPERALRVAQARLAKLWQHGYLERHYLPFAIDGTKRAPSEAATPIYALAERGFSILGKAAADASRQDARHRQVSPATLAHHVVATDFLASIDAAARANGASANVETEHEWSLWKRANDRNAAGAGLIVPDGAVTFRGPDRPTPETWYVEIVRAGVSGGNDGFLHKMRRYLGLRDEGRFARAFGHARVRGVLVATPTELRARTLRALAASLPFGRRFFAFTHYEERSEDRRVKRFRPANIFDLGWTDGAGGVVRLGHAGERGDHAGPNTAL